MPRNNKKAGEVVEELKTKHVYYFVDPDLKVKRKSREVYKNGKKVIHYPFRKNGTPKYRNIKKITYENMPEDLPRGFLKVWNTGYGFTRVYNALVYQLEDVLDIKEIIVGKNIVTKFEDGKLYLNAENLNRSYPRIDTLLKKQRAETDKLVTEILSNYFPKNFKNKPRKYIKDSLAQFIEANVSQTTDLSEKDTQALFDVASKISKENFLDSKTNVLRTRNKIDEVYLEEVVAQFDKLLTLKNRTRKLENRWQKFFTEYNWIFSQLFSFPVLIFKDQAYAGGKNIDNQGSNIADFIFRNNLTNNIAFIEIKTHRTKIFIEKPYRGNDVFAASKDMSGAVNQALGQRDKFQKDFHTIKGNTKEKEFETYNSRCVVIIGSLNGLSEEEKKSFELMRSNSRDVDIVTFDEVLEKIKGLEKLLFGDKKDIKVNQPVKHD